MPGLLHMVFIILLYFTCTMLIPALACIIKLLHVHACRSLVCTTDLRVA